MNLRRIVCCAAAGGLVVATTAFGTPAQAADPPGTLVLASGLSAFAAHGRIVSASTAGAVFTYGPASAGGGEGDPFATAIFKPTHGVEVPLDASVVWDVEGSMLTGRDVTAGNAIRYRTVDSSVSGTIVLADSDRYQGSTPTGWLTVRDVTVGVDTTTHLLVTKAADLTTIDLGPVPGFDPNLGRVEAVPGPNGVSVAATTDTSTHWYVSYAAPSAFTQLLPPSQSVPCSEVAVGTNAEAWLESPDQGVTTEIVRVQLATKAVQRTAVSTNFCDGTVAVTPNQTALQYTTGGPTPTKALTTVAAASGVVHTRTDLDFQFTRVAAQGSNFLVGDGSGLTDAGVYKLASAAATPQLYRLWGTGALAAAAIAVGPGRAGWVDNSQTGIPAWSRTLTSAGNGLTAGAPTLVATHATTFGLSISGQRTLFVTNATVDASVATLWVKQGAAASTALVSEPRGIFGATLSGTRALYTDGVGTWHLLDLVKGSNKTLPQVTYQGGYALSGTSLAQLRTDGSVWWEDVTKGVWFQLASAPSPAFFEGGAVAVSGDEVVWSVTSCGDTGCAAVAAHRNGRTLAPPVYVPTANNAARLAVSGGYVVFSDFENRQLVRISLSDGVTTPIPGTLPYEFSLSGSTLGWIGSDHLPRVLSLPQLPDRPRYLGNGVAATVVAGGQPWSGDFVASAPLASCKVAIKKGNATVRTLACDSALMPQGEAVVAWDGKDAGGVTVALGKYTWTVAAGNADGSMLAANASTTAITGAITIQ